MLAIDYWLLLSHADNDFRRIIAVNSKTEPFFPRFFFYRKERQKTFLLCK